MKAFRVTYKTRPVVPDPPEATEGQRCFLCSCENQLRRFLGSEEFWMKHWGIGASFELVGIEDMGEAVEVPEGFIESGNSV